MKFIVFAFAFATLAQAELPVRNDVEKVISYQTTVKSQKSRGTCTIFSTIGLVEALLRKHNKVDEIDLSEEFLQYSVMTRQMDEGSTVNRNIKKLRFFGLPSEETWPYIGKKWKSLDDDPLARERCAHLEGDDRPLPLVKDDSNWPQNVMGTCLLAHRDPFLLRESDDFVAENDPDFLLIRNEARKIKAELFDGFFLKKNDYRIHNIQKVKELLAENTPVIMGLKLYYGAWNHLKSERFEIQERDSELWYRGIVGYPQEGSIDRRISGEKGGGHSLVIVGYDDEVEVVSRMKLEDGTWSTKTYKGVYYFKNSWGIKGSGKRFELNGKIYPGYGMITQTYAHEFGKFFHLPVSGN